MNQTAIGIDLDGDVPDSEQPPQYSEFEVTQAMSGNTKSSCSARMQGEYELSVEVKPPTLNHPKQKYFGFTEKGRVTEFKLNFNKRQGRFQQ